MNEADLPKLEAIRQEILEALRQKYGADKVQQVDNLGESITGRMLDGEKIPGIEPWMYDLVNDFMSMLMSHPGLTFPLLN